MHIIRSAYGWVDEDELRWKDWNWWYSTIDAILADKRYEHRFQLFAELSSAATAQGGTEAYDWWKQLVDNTYSQAERIARRQAEEGELRRKQDADIAERLAEAQRQVEEQLAQAAKDAETNGLPLMPQATLIF